MRKLLHKYGMLGIPLGLIGFLFESNWFGIPFFIAGAIICGLSWVNQMEIEARRTAEKGGRNQKNGRIDSSVNH